MKIDWARKLTSRKFWAAVVGFVVPLLIAFGVSEEAAAQVASIIMSGASLIAFIIAEGLVDASAAGKDGDDKNV
jgi:formate-dependent nitrite reductase membrane component NrfD